MIGEVVLVIMSMIFGIIGIFLFHGKGAWMISGYNTASKEERQKYDEKKLCRATSVICFVNSAMLCILAYLCYQVDIGLMKEEELIPFVVIFIVVVIVSVIATNIYVEKKAKH